MEEVFGYRLLDKTTSTALFILNFVITIVDQYKVLT